MRVCAAAERGASVPPSLLGTAAVPRDRLPGPPRHLQHFGGSLHDLGRIFDSRQVECDREPAPCLGGGCLQVLCARTLVAGGHSLCLGHSLSPHLCCATHGAPEGDAHFLHLPGKSCVASTRVQEETRRSEGLSRNGVT